MHVANDSSGYSGISVFLGRVGDTEYLKKQENASLVLLHRLKEISRNCLTHPDALCIAAGVSA